MTSLLFLFVFVLLNLSFIPTRPFSPFAKDSFRWLIR
jgi:hypothetical protein